MHRLRHQFLTTDSSSRRLNQGRPHTTTSADDLYLSLCVRRNRTATPAELRSFSLLAPEFGIKVNHASKDSRKWSLTEATSHLPIPTLVTP
ncbi:hypothetical protein TNCV_2074581 [Trichonephila clavipes]|nr:hypothetical protein TNCV_2074581 [Trichonephila clavipes]